MKHTANSVGDTLIQRQPDDALTLALELLAAIEVLLTASGTLRRAFIAADPQALTIAEIVAARRRETLRCSSNPAPSIARSMGSPPNDCITLLSSWRRPRP